MRLSKLVLNVLSLLFIGAGAALAVAFFVPAAWEGRGSAGTLEEFDVPLSSERASNVAAWPRSLVPGRGSTGASANRGGTFAKVPQDKTLRLTIPAMARIEGDEIPTSSGTAENKLRNNAAIHLRGTGFPWQRQANVYVAGHRIGYPGTESFLTFYDLDDLEAGDHIFLADANGRRYIYRVFRSLVVTPTNLSVTRPLAGKNLLTLQTCTLPDYTRRLIVQAERISQKAPASSSQPARKGPHKP